MLADVDRLYYDMNEDVADYRLIGRHNVRDNNSWMHNHRRLVKGKHRYQLLMRPNDVAKQGWNKGMQVIVTSRVGIISAELMP